MVHGKQDKNTKDNKSRIGFYAWVRTGYGIIDVANKETQDALDESKKQAESYKKSNENIGQHICIAQDKPYLSPTKGHMWYCKDCGKLMSDDGDYNV